ncbi:hypothetical protein [Shewanella algae]|uniref:hypothetical protein n=1 Tax=Shewanella algae TaxID=38313 RepID=UPI001AAC9DE2|nr:hypothetical protein [Shewanella algae]MBO2660251.1 hypothetical protein [Shewanella algae]
MTSSSDVTQWQALADGYPQVKSISRPFDGGALSCLISRHQVPALLDLLRRYLQQHGMEIEQLGEGLPDYLVLAQQLQCQGDNFETEFQAPIKLYLQLTTDFGGYLLCLQSDHSELLAQVQQLAPTPPMPWESFPELDPDTLGGLQGSLAFWQDYLWGPYWQWLRRSGIPKLGDGELALRWEEYSHWHNGEPELAAEQI